MHRAGKSVVVVAILGGSIAASNAAQPGPVLVELYTSEGCSSCPPADALLGEIAARPDVIALAMHVDYWDDLGWRDRFSLAEATARQQKLARALRLKSVATPQFFVAGGRSILGADRSAVLNAIGATLPQDSIAVRLDGRESFTVTVAADDARPRSAVFLAGVVPRTETAIRRGENSGKTLVEVNSVRSLRLLGAVGARGKSWSVPVASVPGDAKSVAVWLERAATAEVVAAASVIIR